jgi:acyl-CoA oxidase
MTEEAFDPKTMGGSIKRGIVNPDLLEERAKCTFDQSELERFLIGEDVIAQTKYMAQMIDKYPSLKSDFDYFEMSREEKMAEWWRRFQVMFQQEETAKVILNNSDKKDFQFSWHYLFPGNSPMHLHQSMFTKSIGFLGSDKQKAEYLKKADHWNIIGCYAQTELGHGSNVAGLETTAKLDLPNDEFVIHSPSFKASKFWPGSLGL